MEMPSVTRPGTRFMCKFALAEKVHIDGHTDIVATVTGLQIRGSGHTYNVAWIHAGQNQDCWIEEYRLSLAGD